MFYCLFIRKVYQLRTTLSRGCYGVHILVEYLLGEIGGVLLKEGLTMTYRSVNDIKNDEVGPCLVPGHPKEHKLSPGCWAAMRRYLFNHSFTDYVKEVAKKE